jgi:internalin A
MQKMAESDRVYIFLSDKYLKSPFCMFELFEVFRNSKQQKVKFLQRINIFSIDKVGIYSPQDRLSYSEYWKEEREQLKQKIDRVGINGAGEDAIMRYRLMKKFSDEVSDVLVMIADRVQAKTFDDFVRSGFDGNASSAPVSDLT